MKEERCGLGRIRDICYQTQRRENGTLFPVIECSECPWERKEGWEKVVYKPKQTLETLFKKASELWSDTWLMQPVYLENLPSSSPDFLADENGVVFYRVSVRNHRGYVMDVDPVKAMEMAFEKWEESR